MADPAAAQLLRQFARHPVLPPAEGLPANDEAFRALVADLTRGDRSSHGAVLREVAEGAGLTVEELARRARFLLACLLIPASGTHYEVLGVAPNATTREIRRRWAALIRRYHPDRFSAGGGDWLGEQARRVLEAYQTLKDPARRRRYDLELARRSAAGRPLAEEARRRVTGSRFAGSARWWWVPLGLLAVGLAAGVLVFTRSIPPPREVPLPTLSAPASPPAAEIDDEVTAR